MVKRREWLLNENEKMPSSTLNKINNTPPPHHQHTQNQKFLNSRVCSLFYCPTFVSSLTTDTQGGLSYPAGHKAKSLLPWRGWVGQVPVLRQLAWSL